MLTQPEQSAVMVRLWGRMRGMFGQQWVRDFGEVKGEQIKIWQTALSGLSLEQIKRGINACASWSEKFPPNVGQFAKLCLTTNENSPEFQAQLGAPRRKCRGIPPEVAEVWKEITTNMSTERDEAFYAAARHLGIRVK
jgi:hypothetical protein